MAMVNSFPDDLADRSSYASLFAIHFTAPKKGQKMSLFDFNADEATGQSWADDVDDLPIACG